MSLWTLQPDVSYLSPTVTTISLSPYFALVSGFPLSLSPPLLSLDPSSANAHAGKIFPQFQFPFRSLVNPPYRSVYMQFQFPFIALRYDLKIVPLDCLDLSNPKGLAWDLGFALS